MAEPAGVISHAAQDRALFQTLIATAVDGIMVIDARGRVEVYNRACERLFQYRPDEVIGRNVKMLMPQPYRDEHDGYLSRYGATGERGIIGIGREVVGLRKDATTFPMYLSVGEGLSAGRRIFVGIVHDLSETRTEVALRHSASRRLAAIVESSSDAILSKTLDGIVTSWNGAAERLLGYRSDEMVGQAITIIFPPDRICEEQAILEKIRRGEKVDNYETVRRRKDGNDIDVSVTISPLHDAEGNVVGASKILRDITDRKRSEARIRVLQAELVHAARLSAMGQLSSALAHELNQPLAATMNYVNAGRRLLAPSDDPRTLKAGETLDKAAAQIGRAGQIIRSLREFVEKRDAKRAAYDINAIADEAIKLGLVGMLDNDTKLTRQFSSGLDRVFVDKVQIQQVLINLMRNAMDAMQASPRRELVVTTAADEESGVVVSVADSGPGVPEGIAHRLFEPFFTTKSKGMGIGLVICRSIIESYEGKMWLTPNEGGGSIFRFRLPTIAPGDTQDDG